MARKRQYRKESRLKMFYVTRIDQGYTHCWQVRVAPEWDAGKSRTFTDNLYGGTQQALEAAMIWRDKTIQYLNANYDNLNLRLPMMYRNWIEHKIWIYTIKNGNKYWYQSHVILASIARTLNGKRIFNKRRQWSVPRWGREKAIANAEEWITKTLKSLGEL